MSKSPKKFDELLSRVEERINASRLQTRQNTQDQPHESKNQHNKKTTIKEISKLIESRKPEDSFTEVAP